MISWLRVTPAYSGANRSPSNSSGTDRVGVVAPGRAHGTGAGRAGVSASVSPARASGRPEEGIVVVARRSE